jgi:hypothetical protein
MGDEGEKEAWAPMAFLSWMGGVERARAEIAEIGAGLVTDLWVLMIDRGDGTGELIAATDDGSAAGLAMVSTEPELFEHIDLAEMARMEGATIRLRHFRACHDQGEFKP